MSKNVIVIQNISTSVEGNCKTVSVKDGQVYVDGKPVGDKVTKGPIDIRWEGPAVNIHCDGDVEVNGNVGGYVDAAGSVSCGDVGTNVVAGGSVSAVNVSGRVDAGGSVTAQNVGGSIRAQGSVRANVVHGTIEV